MPSSGAGRQRFSVPGGFPRVRGGSVPLLALAGMLLLVPAGTVRAAACAQDEVVLDANVDGFVTVGDAILAPPGEVGPVGGDHPLLNRPVVALAGDFSYLDADANGAPSFRDIALFDRGSDGRGQGDVLLGNTTWDNHTYPAGRILQASDPLPAANVYAYSGGLEYFDESGDGKRQPEEGIYAAAGGQLSAGDVRVSVQDWPAGSFVRASDPLVGQPLTAGPAAAFLDENGSGGFDIASCPASSSSSSSASSSSTSSSSAPPSPSSSTSTEPAPTTEQGSSSTAPANRIPAPAAGLVALGLVAMAFARRRLR